MMKMTLRGLSNSCKVTQLLSGQQSGSKVHALVYPYKHHSKILLFKIWKKCDIHRHNVWIKYVKDYYMSIHKYLKPYVKFLYLQQMIVLFLPYLLHSKELIKFSGYLKSEYSWCELNSHMCTVTHNHTNTTSLREQYENFNTINIKTKHKNIFW